MHIVILGGGGFLGQKLVRALAARGSLRGAQITGVTLADMTDPASVEAPFPVATRTLDVTDAQAVSTALAEADVIYHLAAVVSGAAERDFDLGLSVNLHGTLTVLEAARQTGRCPVLVFASSIAVYGGDVPDPIQDHSALQPQTSYGAQKAAAELLVNDFSRKGFVDGRALRLPTVTIRPGKPNAAASSFMSSIFREPLQGQTANCPVAPDYPIWHASPRTTVDNLVLGAELDGAAFGQSRSVALPGRTDTVAEMIAAMTRVAGPEPASRITWTPEPAVRAVVEGWRASLDTQKALALGFECDASFDDNVRYFLQDDRVSPA